jgi:hypothetical protein
MTSRALSRRGIFLTGAADEMREERAEKFIIKGRQSIETIRKV